jgi:hypothetical protein
MRTKAHEHHTEATAAFVFRLLVRCRLSHRGCVNAMRVSGGGKTWHEDAYDFLVQWRSVANARRVTAQREKLTWSGDAMKTISK